MELGVAVTIALFVIGIAYQTGRLTVRVEKLEEWRTEQRAQHAENIARFEQLETLIRNGSR